MGLKDGAGASSTLWRRKQVHQTRRGEVQLAKHLRVPELVSIGENFVWWSCRKC